MVDYSPMTSNTGIARSEWAFLIGACLGAILIGGLFHFTDSQRASNELTRLQQSNDSLSQEMYARERDIFVWKFRADQAKASADSLVSVIAKLDSALSKIPGKRVAVRDRTANASDTALLRRFNDLVKSQKHDRP